MKKGRLLVCVGTRPEAIKMLPVVKALSQQSDFVLKCCSTGQHRDLLDQTLPQIPIAFDWNLALMQAHQSIGEFSARCLEQLPKVFDEFRPDMVLVQGDTTTALMGGLSAFYKKIAVAHVEAGLRTFQRYSPFPEEMNRLILSNLSNFHFCPTDRAKKNLLREGADENSIFVTGNTSIDALKELWNSSEEHPRVHQLIKKRKIILVTAHRRENFGKKMTAIFQSLRQIAEEFTDYQFVFPVHPNPQIKSIAEEILSKQDRIALLEPLSHSEMVYLLKKVCGVLTDSGGLQEEAPCLGIPTLILREDTERPEALETGYAVLVGTDPRRMRDQFSQLHSQGAFDQKPRWVGGPFGNGDASTKIAGILREWWGKKRLAEGERLELSSPFGRRISSAVEYQLSDPSIKPL